MFPTRGELCCEFYFTTDNILIESQTASSTFSAQRNLAVLQIKTFASKGVVFSVSLQLALKEARWAGEYMEGFQHINSVTELQILNSQRQNGHNFIT